MESQRVRHNQNDLGGVREHTHTHTHIEVKVSNLTSKGVNI